MKHLEAGFSTIEVLVAFVILCLGLGIAMQSIGMAARNAAVLAGGDRDDPLIEDYVAERLDQLIEGYRGGDQTVVDGQFRVRIRAADPGQTEKTSPRLFHVWIGLEAQPRHFWSAIRQARRYAAE